MSEVNKIYLLRGNDTPLSVCLRKREGDGDPVPYDLSEAERIRLALVGHGAHVFASGVTVSGEDNNIVSGVIPGRALLKGDYDLEVTFRSGGRDKRFAVEDMFEAVDFLAEDADGETEGEGAGIWVNVTVQPEVIEIAGPTGPRGYTPVLTADEDGTIYADGVLLTEVVKDVTEAVESAETRRAEQAASDHTRAENDHTRAENDHGAIATLSGRVDSLEGDVSQLGLEVNGLDYTTDDADVHQVNTSSTVETTSGTRLRLLFYVFPGAIVSASCPLGSGLAAGVYSTRDYAVIAGNTGLLQSLLGGNYVHSLQNAVISAEGYLSISLKKSDGSSFSAQEKEQYLSETIVSITKDGLAQNVDELGQEVTIINSSIGEVPPALMSKDLEYSKLSETFWNAYSADNTSVAVFMYSPFIIKNIKIGVITSLTAKFASIGKITIGKIKVVDVIVGQAFDYTKILGRKSYNIPTTGEQTIQIEPLYIADDEYIAIGMPSDSAVFYYGSSGGTMRGYYYVGSNGILTQEPASGRYLGVKVDGYEYTTIPCTMVENGFFASDTLMSIVGRERVTRLFYNGYSASNNTMSIPANSPFPIAKDYDTDYYVNSIKLRIASPGNLTIGKIKKADAMPGAIADRSKVFDKIVLTFEKVGEYTCKLPSSWDSKIKMDEYLVLQDIGDTAMFYYGNTTPRDRGFLYILPSTGAWAATQSSLNVDINVDIIYQDSSYTGKKISILGDSISTFAGYIPEGNATYYPTGTVQSVEDTWWKKLINALGLELDINNSWSGSRVTTTAGETSAGCMSRCQNLGDPDVIIIWMGINDFNNEVALGTYDGKSAVPSNTTTFREAYAIMLDKVLTAYPRAEIWACTLPQCERNGTTGFPEINGNGISLLDFNIAIEELARAFGVKVLDHNRCGLTYQNMSVYNPDNLHPNKYGHSLIANNDIRQMDNVIRWRFPIA